MMKLNHSCCIVVYQLVSGAVPAWLFSCKETILYTKTMTYTTYCTCWFRENRKHAVYFNCWFHEWRNHALYCTCMMVPEYGNPCVQKPWLIPFTVPASFRSDETMPFTIPAGFSKEKTVPFTVPAGFSSEETMPLLYLLVSVVKKPCLYCICWFQ